MIEKSNIQTERLYWINSYVTEFEAKIISISSNELILDKTAFYPFGGGQISDLGEIIFKEKNNEIKFTVINVEINAEGNIIHFLSRKNLEKLRKGDSIIGKIDWERRFELMKAHTAQHILSALIENLFNVKTTKAVIETNETVIYLEKKITDEDLQKALFQTNETLLSGKNIVTNFYNKKNIPENISKHLRGDLSTKESEVRVVTIDNLDDSLCGGTHCQNTSEIGIIILNDFKGDIIYFSHGKQAIENISKINLNQIAISKLLAIKPIDINKKITKVLTEINSLKLANVALSKKVVEYRMAHLKANPIFYGKIKILKENFDYSERKFVLQQLGDLPKDMLAIFVVKGPVLLLLSEIPSLPANVLIQAYSTKTGNKGGGSSKIAQAVINDSEKDLQILLEIIEEKIENGQKKNL
ncbi:MAG: hypothetical protein JXA54_13535 [Candidatus Heimdallarchaeota archaeon]|nr:hypothetical protein [Candidatus Heimdallarchaeota archaeon]